MIKVQNFNKLRGMWAMARSFIQFLINCKKLETRQIQLFSIYALKYSQQVWKNIPKEIVLIIRTGVQGGDPIAVFFLNTRTTDRAKREKMFLLNTDKKK